MIQRPTAYLPHLWLSKIRSIEDLWKRAKIAIYGDKNFKPEEEVKIDKKMQIINLAYELAKQKFEWKIRKISQERYFEHLRETANIIIDWELWEDIDEYQIVLALLHDIIEDTNMDFESLSKALSDQHSTKFAKKIAHWVVDLSKKDWHEYIILSEEQDFVKFYEDGSAIYEEDDLFWKDKKSSQDHKKYQDIKKKAKTLRDHDYNCRLWEIKDDRTLKVKFADRIHNLRTQWDPDNIEQVKKKIRETKMVYLPLAEKRNQKAYEIMLQEIETLEEKLWNSVQVTWVIDRTKSWSQLALAQLNIDTYW